MVWGIISADISGLFSKEPNPSKETPDGNEEAEPDLPSHTGLLGHSQHSSHGASQLDSCVVEAFIHLVREVGGIADLIANGHGQLLELRDLGGKDTGVFVFIL
jgi:hypothetical protein